MVNQSIHTSDDDASDISNVLSVKRSRQIQVCQRSSIHSSGQLEWFKTNVDEKSVKVGGT